jgi:hypothetical protein
VSRCIGPSGPGSARWQRGDVVEGFYLADSEETTWAEWYRSLAELALPPMRQMSRDLWRFEVGVERVADLSSSEQLARVNVEPALPDRRQWPAYQTVGETLFADSSARATSYRESARCPRRSVTTSPRPRHAACEPD